MKGRGIGINTIKISLAAILAILAAELLGLENPISAGIVAILTIQPTKKETVRTAAERCLAFAAALLLAYLSFSAAGYRGRGFFLYLLLFVLICQSLGWYSAIAMDSVLISHFLGFGSMAWEYLINEVLIFGIGTVFGISANLHLGKDQSRIRQLIEGMDGQIRSILRRMAERLRREPGFSQGDECRGCFQILERDIQEALSVARTNFANQFGKEDVFDLEYISMRQRQKYILMEMDKNIRSMRGTPETAGQISEFLMRVYREYEQANPVSDLMERFRILDETMKARPLPLTRTEFEDRAQLYVLLRKTEEFLEIKRAFMNRGLGLKDGASCCGKER